MWARMSAISWSLSVSAKAGIAPSSLPLEDRLEELVLLLGNLVGEVLAGAAAAGVIAVAACW